MESILTAIHQEIALISELSGEEDPQIKEDFLVVLESVLTIMKKSSDIITVQKSIQLLKVSRTSFVYLSFTCGSTFITLLFTTLFIYLFD